jgi:PIN domain nuclease of toxin-antitoxin system
VSSAVADTHTVIWYLHEPEKLSQVATLTLDNAILSGGKIYISTITIVELTYLIEKKKVDSSVMDKLLSVLDDPNSEIDSYFLTDEIAKAVKNVPRDLVPDMPDRIIAATAMNLNLPLVTRDEKLRNFPQLTTVW